MIYAEIAVAYESVAELDSFLKPTGIVVSPISNQVNQIATICRTPLACMSLPAPRAMNSPRCMTR